MEELSEAEEETLLWIYVIGSIWENVDPNAPMLWLHPLSEKGYLKETYQKGGDGQDISIYKLTRTGRRYIEVIPPQCLILRLAAMPLVAYGTMYKLVSRCSLESLSILLSHENPRVRRLARKRYEELKNGRVN